LLLAGELCIERRPPVQLRTARADRGAEVEDLEKGRNKILGFFLAFSIVGAAMVTLSIMVIDDKIDDGIRQALSAYNIEVR
jgi:hypothetical protein